MVNGILTCKYIGTEVCDFFGRPCQMSWSIYVKSDLAQFASTGIGLHIERIKFRETETSIFDAASVALRVVVDLGVCAQFVRGPIRVYGALFGQNDPSKRLLERSRGLDGITARKRLCN